MSKKDNKQTIAGAEAVRQKVREGYGQIAQSDHSRKKGVSCCGSSPEDSEKLVKQIGYTEEELAALPEGANMGLSCGNPTALASLQPGDVVLDLGAGGGFDVFIAGQKLGPTGRAIGVDMTAEMLSKARRNLGVYQERTGWDNVEFRLGEIEHLPAADASIDVVISNCVINLSPNKPQVWREIARVLKPGGRVAVSDMALLKPLPQEVREMVEALVGCVAGAVLVSETEQMAREAGLEQIQLKAKPDYIEALSGWDDPLYQKIAAHFPAGAKASDYVTSLEITARKPAGASNGESVYTPAVGELVAFGAAIAANCEPCFKYHYDKARKLGVSSDDMASAVNTAQAVKQTPARAMLEVADRILHGEVSTGPEQTCCAGIPAPGKNKGKCC